MLLNLNVSVIFSYFRCAYTFIISRVNKVNLHFYGWFGH